MSHEPTPDQLSTWLKQQLGFLREELRSELRSELQAGAAAAGPATPIEPRGRGRTALICSADPAFTTELSQVLKQLGHKTERTGTEMAASARLSRREVSVVVVGPTLEEGTPEGLLNRLSRLPSDRRRATFVVAVRDGVRAADAGIAFMMGANLVMTPADLPRFSELLAEGSEDRDDFYHVFESTLEEVGG
ncbi:MAG: hypothetical protein AAF533_19940 [Acidobacteriota bacterium]